MSPIYDEELEDLMTFGISSKGYVYSWDINKKVRAGSPINLDKYIPAYDYSIPEGMSTEEIVGMAIAKSNDYVYTWYQNNNRSIGHTNNLIDRGNLVKYYLPKGYKPEDVIGMGISNRDIVYTWYKKNGCRAI